MPSVLARQDFSSMMLWVNWTSINMWHSARGSQLGLVSPGIPHLRLLPLWPWMLRCFLQATNDANDQFLRKLSVYAKGKINKLDYRLVLSRPFSFSTSTFYNPSSNIGSDAQFTPQPPQPQYSGYLSWQFLDQESNELPYQVGTYLGKKRVLNIGSGFQFQQDAMWYTQVKDSTSLDTLHHDMMLAAVDIYYDAPLRKEKGDAISFYAVASFYDFGKNYVRNVGPMNVTDGVNAKSVHSGTGVAWPMIGTGMSYYAQIGYLSPALSHTKPMGRLMPYISAQLSQYDIAKDIVIYGDLGCSWGILMEQDRNSRSEFKIGRSWKRSWKVPMFFFVRSHD
jgi:hypothetical protein